LRLVFFGLLKLPERPLQVVDPGAVFGDPHPTEITGIQMLSKRFVGKPAHRVKLDRILVDLPAGILLAMVPPHSLPFPRWSEREKSRRTRSRFRSRTSPIFYPKTRFIWRGLFQIFEEPLVKKAPPVTAGVKPGISRVVFMV
jgi:hypothetical protein